MSNPVNTGVAPVLQGTENEKNTTTLKEKRKHKKYIPTIDLEALENVEGSTLDSFILLARAVILIDGIPYDEKIIPMSKARKISFERLISHHAQLEVYGTRKYCVKAVYEKVRKKIPNDTRLTVIKKAPYNEPKKLSKAELEAERKAREILYKAKKEREKEVNEIKAQKKLDKAHEKAEEIKNSPIESEEAEATE